MRNELALTKNVAALQVAFESLATRDLGVPGMGLVHGYTGAGKTTAITRLVNRTNGVYVRATSGWTPTSMLAKIMSELGSAPLQRRADMLDWIQNELMATQRPLFVDEADYLVGASHKPMLESLRDLHDLASVPVVLIGMQGIEKRLIPNKQLTRRISHWVEFMPSDLEDAATLAATVCEVGIDEELLQRLHTEAKGSVGLMVVGLSRVESLAKANGWRKVTAAQWGDRKLFMGGAPRGAEGL